MKPTIRGIVVAGNTLEEVQELYRAVATGQDVKALHDEGETFVVLSSAASDISMINPLTGADDLHVGDGLTEQMEFLSSDSEAVNINYTICTAGCNAHILADDRDMLQHCPACASALPELTAEEITALSAQGEEDGECDGCQVSAIASGATVEEAVAAFQALVYGEHETSEASTMKCGNVLVATAGAANFDVYKGCASTIVQHEPEFLEAMASSADELDAHHFVCASASCGLHVVSSDDMPVFCPSCSSGLMDAEDEEATASGLTPEQEEALAAELEEDEFAALSASDEDDEEEEEDDEDEEEEDDEDEEEEDDEDEDDEEEEDDEDDDEEDEDEDDEDALTMSVSSVVESESPANRRARNRQEARASAQQEEEHEQHQMVAVAASYVAIAGDLQVKDLELTYAALSSGNTWLIFHKGVPVFKATAATAEKHEQIFNSEVFGKAFLAQANEQGLPAAVENMGFEEIKPVIQVADFVQSEIAKQVEVKTQAVEAIAAQDKAELVERFGAAMALAATGITKNFFKGQTNPIANQLIESLSAVGIDNAAGLVNSAFAQNSEPYHKALLAQACKILSYGLEAQNEIAQAVSDFNNVEATASVQAPVSMGRPVQVVTPKPQEKVEATASAKPPADFSVLLQGAVSGLGKR